MVTVVVKDPRHLAMRTRNMVTVAGVRGVVGAGDWSGDGADADGFLDVAGSAVSSSADVRGRVFEAGAQRGAR
jgi:hypothetical protein